MVLSGVLTGVKQSPNSEVHPCSRRIVNFLVYGFDLASHLSVVVAELEI
jgi:hypothetical protein